MRLARRALGTALAFSMLLTAAPALAAEEAESPSAAKADTWERAGSIGKKAFDVVPLRPLQSLAVVAGAALVVPAAVMASPGGLPAIEEAWDFFVVIRYEDAWTRSLGDF